VSAAAAQAAKQITHPKVKGSRRALLDTIAKLIPEGETMTPPVADDVLATLIGFDERTVLRARKVLVMIRAVRVVGGQGRVASYELLALPGAGADPSLPLIGRVPPPASRRPIVPDHPDLFDRPPRDVVEHTSSVADRAVRAYTVRQFVRSCATYFRQFVRSWRPRTSDNLSQAIIERKTSDNLSEVRPTVVDVDDARARGSTYTEEKEHVHTHTAPARTVDDPPPSPLLHPWHAWCAGKVHVPRQLHEEFQRRLRLTHAQLVAIYVAEDAALSPTEVILEDEFTFWRRRMARRFPTRADRAPPASRPTTRDAWVCPHTPHCLHRTPCQRLSDLAAAKAGAERDRQTG
jgi:hypothetical protein